MTALSEQEKPREPEARIAGLEIAIRRMEERFREIDERAPRPRWTTFARWLSGAFALLFVLGLIVLSTRGGTSSRGVKIAAAAFGGFGTVTQAFLAADGGPMRREAEAAEEYRRRMNSRDRWDVSAWAAITVSVLAVLVTEINS